MGDLIFGGENPFPQRFRVPVIPVGLIPSTPGERPHPRWGQSEHSGLLALVIGSGRHTIQAKPVKRPARFLELPNLEGAGGHLLTDEQETA